MEVLDRYVLDNQSIVAAMHKKGFRSAQALADKLGLHRNTLSDYLNGAPVMPLALAKVLRALELAPVDVLKSALPAKQIPGLPILGLADQLIENAPAAAIVLFGSRARETAKPFSDYDLGIYTKEPVQFKHYSKLLDIVEEFNDTQLLTVQLVNLRNADSDFLRQIANDLVFLAGSAVSWESLLKAGGLQVYE